MVDIRKDSQDKPAAIRIHDLTLADKEGRSIMTSMLILISALVASTAVYHLIRADLFLAELSSPVGIALFTALAAIPYGAAYYLFRKFINPVNNDLKAVKPLSSYFRLTYYILVIAFYSSAVFLAIIIIQIVISSEFSVGLTLASMQANSALTIITFGYLSYKFLSWYRSNGELAVLFFGLTFASIAFATAASNGTQTAFFLLDDPARIEGPPIVPVLPDDAGYFNSDNQKSDPILQTIFRVTQFPMRVAFVLYWIAIAALLRRYSKSVGRLRFWTIVSLPLVTFIIGSIFTYGNIIPQLYQGIILPATSLLGGILFGLIFLTIAKGLRTRKGGRGMEKDNNRHHGRGQFNTRYLTMAAFGTILFIVTNTPSNHIIDWVHIPYPPFADVVWSFLGFAAYVYGFGLYFSVVSISQDAKLRRAMQQLAMEEARMLHSLGSAEMEQAIQKRVSKILKDNEEEIEKETGVSQQANEEEIKRYLYDAMEEVQKSKKKTSVG